MKTKSNRKLLDQANAAIKTNKDMDMDKATTSRFVVYINGNRIPMPKPFLVHVKGAQVPFDPALTEYWKLQKAVRRVK